MLEGSHDVVSLSVPNTFQQSLDADLAATADWQVRPAGMLSSADRAVLSELMMNELSANCHVQVDIANVTGEISVNHLKKNEYCRIKS